MSGPRHAAPGSQYQRPAVPPVADGANRQGALRRAAERVAGLHVSRDMREYLDRQRQLTTAVAYNRRIVVMSVGAAQGATTVSALLAAALATRRADPVLLVDASAIGPNPLARVFLADPERTLGSLAAAPPEVTARSDFPGLLTSVGRDVWLIPGDERVGYSGTQAPDAATYAAGVNPFIRYFDLSVTDLGSAPGAGTSQMLLERAHAVCLVTTATREGFDAVTGRLRDLRDNRGLPWAGRTVVVVNSPTPHLRAAGTRRRSLPARGVPVTQIGYDSGIRPGFPAALSTLTPEIHLAAMRLTANVLGTAIPTAIPTGSSGPAGPAYPGADPIPRGWAG